MTYPPGPPQPYGQQPYGHQPYGHQPYGYGYQPYGAVPVVADPGPAPGRVRLAFWLLITQLVLSLALGLPAAYLSMGAILASQRPTPGVDPESFFGVVFGIAVFVVVVVDGVWALFAVKFLQGREWARITLLVLTGVGVIYAPINLIQQVRLGPFVTVNAIVGLAFSITIGVLLLIEPAKSWTPAKSRFLKAQRLGVQPRPY